MFIKLRYIKILLRAYYTYVRPILEYKLYNSVVWSPILKYEIYALERVQRRFTKRLRVINLLSYSDRSTDQTWTKYTWAKTSS